MTSLYIQKMVSFFGEDKKKDTNKHKAICTETMALCDKLMTDILKMYHHIDYLHYYNIVQIIIFPKLFHLQKIHR